MGKKTIGLALLAALSIGGSVAATPAPAANAATSTTSARDGILSDTNAARKAEGHKALRESAAMDAVAQAWAKKLAKSGTLAHNPDYSSSIPSGWTRAAENVAGGYSYAKVTDAWLNSSGHRANIMGDFTEIGIGYAVDSSGTAWAVQNFGKYSKAPGAAPSKVSRPSASNSKSRRLVITWKAAASSLDITSYTVVVVDHAGRKVQTIVLKGSEARTATTKLLGKGHTYRAKVRARNAVGSSPFSSPSLTRTILK